jgi:hypothetical protein
MVFENFGEDVTREIVSIKIPAAERRGIKPYRALSRAG